MKQDRRWICFQHRTTHSHIRNPQLVEQRRRRCESGIQVAKGAGIDVQEYYRLETKEKSPLKIGQRWRQHVLQLCEYWSCEPEDLFPADAAYHHSRLPGTGDVLMSAWSTRAADPQVYEDILLCEPGNKALRNVVKKLSIRALGIFLQYTLDGQQTNTLAEKYCVTPQAILQRVYAALGVTVRRTLRGSRHYSRIKDVLGKEWAR